MFKNTTFSWPRAKKGLQFLINESKDPLPIQSEYALLATMVKDKSSAQDMFKKIGDKYDSWAWISKRWYVWWRDQAFGDSVDADKQPPDD